MKTVTLKRKWPAAAISKRMRIRNVSGALLASRMGGYIAERGEQQYFVIDPLLWCKGHRSHQSVELSVRKHLDSLRQEAVSSVSSGRERKEQVHVTPILSRCFSFAKFLSKMMQTVRDNGPSLEITNSFRYSCWRPHFWVNCRSNVKHYSELLYPQNGDEVKYIK